MSDFFSSEKNFTEHLLLEERLTASLLSSEKESDLSESITLYFASLKQNISSFREVRFFLLHFFSSLLFWIQKEYSSYSIPASPLSEIYKSDNIKDLENTATLYLLHLWSILHTDEQLSAEACVKNLMKQIQANPRHVGTLETNAQKYHISKYVLCRYFKRYTGKNCGEYIKEIRIEKAKKLLRETDSKIYEISQKVGFQDAGYFTQYFRNAVGVTPKAFRSGK